MVEEAPCCACDTRNTAPPVIAIEEFRFCRPVIGADDIAATECSTVEHNLPFPQPRQVLSTSCSIPATNP